MPWCGNTFFHVCNFQTAGYPGPTTFNLIQYENNTLTILNTTTVIYGFFSIMGAFPTDGILYTAGYTDGNKTIGYYIFDVNNTFSLKLIGERNNLDDFPCPNAIVSSDQSYFVSSIFTGVAHLHKISLPNLKIINRNTYPPGGQYIFYIPTNNSYASFWIAPANYMDGLGLVYQNKDFNNWVKGAVVIDNNSTFYSVSYGISYAQTYVDNCFYVAALNCVNRGTIATTITQIELTTSLTTPQNFIAQIFRKPQTLILAAGSSAIYITNYEKNPIILTYPVSCTTK